MPECLQVGCYGEAAGPDAEDPRGLVDVIDPDDAKFCAECVQRCDLGGFDPDTCTNCQLFA